MLDLYAKVAELVGRPVEVERTKDGKYIVLFMALGFPPPPKGDDEKGALEAFLSWAEGIPGLFAALSEADLHDDTRPMPKDDVSEF